MAKPTIRRKESPERMEPDLLGAARSMNLDAVIAAVEADKTCVRQRDQETRQNAIHILVNAGFFRTRNIIEYLLSTTEISLHDQDKWGRDPVDLAEQLNDDEGAEFLYQYWLRESHEIERNQERSSKPDPAM